MTEPTSARSSDRSVTQDRIRTLAERRLSADEWAAGSAIPITDEERAETLALIAWFCRRYPTPAERLAYVRRAYRRWTASATAR